MKAIRKHLSRLAFALAQGRARTALRPVSYIFIIGFTIIAVVTATQLQGAIEQQKLAFQTSQAIDQFLESVLVMESDYREVLLGDQEIIKKKMNQDLEEIRLNLSILQKMSNEHVQDLVYQLQAQVDKRIDRITANIKLIENNRTTPGSSKSFADRSDHYSKEVLNVANQLDGVAKALFERESQEVDRILLLSLLMTFALSIATLLISFRLIRSLDHALEIKAEKETVLRSSNERAQQASKFKSDFLANVSHEIRTPLQGIIGLADMIEAEALSDSGKKSVKVIKDSGQTLLRIVNDILDVSKIEAGKMELENEEFPISDLADRIKTLYSHRAKSKKLSLDVFTDPRLPKEIQADFGRLFQICSNLVGNAIKFTEQGYVRVGFSVDHDKNNKTLLVLQVSDSGVGISEDKFEYVFQPFCRDSNHFAQSGIEGAGLGLAITRQLVQLMGGTIKIESCEGKGSSFTVTVPIEEAPSQSTDTPTTSGSNPISGLRTTKYQYGSQKTKTSELHSVTDLASVIKGHVLLAEDNTTNQWILTTFIQKLGFKVHVVNNGLEALEALKRSHYDLVLMDHRMPEMDGVEAVNKIRLEFTEPLKNIPVIALTANAMKGDREKFIEAGMDDYLSKPVRIEDLRHILLRWMPSIDKSFDKRSLYRLQLHMPVTHLSTMVETFLKKLLGYSDQILSAAKSSNLEDLRHYTHSLKSSSATLGAMKLSEQCKIIETGVDNEAQLDYVKLAQELQTETLLVKKSLEEFSRHAFASGSPSERVNL